MCKNKNYYLIMRNLINNIFIYFLRNFLCFYVFYIFIFYFLVIFIVIFLIFLLIFRFDFFDFLFFQIKNLLCQSQKEGFYFYQVKSNYYL